MNTLHLIRLASEAEPQLAWLGPTLGFSGGIVIALLGLIGTVYRRSQDRKDQVADQANAKTATQSDGWDEIRMARNEATKYYNLYVTFRGAFDIVQQALRHLARKWRERFPEEEVEQSIVDALALKPQTEE